MAFNSTRYECSYMNEYIEIEHMAGINIWAIFFLYKLILAVYVCENER